MPRTQKTRPFNVLDLCRLLSLSLSLPQETVLRAFYGLPLSKEHRGIYERITARTQYHPGHAYQELTVVAGARSGKDSRIVTPIAIFEALWGGHETRVVPGEHPVIAIVAQGRDGTQVAFGYIKGAVLAHPLLRNELAEEPLQTELTFKNGVKVMTFPSSVKSLRAWSICVGIADELAFFKNDETGANADVEIISSIRRGQVSFGEHAKLVKISTPFAKEGVLFDDFESAFGKDDPDILVVRATTAEMNPTIATKTLDRERRRDPKRYGREYLAEFQDAFETFTPQALIDTAVVLGRNALPAVAGRVYLGAIDASGGGSCAFTLDIVSLDLGRKPDIVECQSKGWERSRTQPLDLEGGVAEASDIFFAYGITHVLSDRYSAGWARQAFGRHGVVLIDAQDKSTTYGDLDPVLGAGRVAMLDQPVKNRQLGLLERRPRPGGKPLIGPPRGSFDDYANSFALACVAAAQNLDLPPYDPSADIRQEIAQIQAAFGPEWHQVDLDGIDGLRL